MNDIVTENFDETVPLYIVFVVLDEISHCSSQIVGFRMSVPLIEKKEKNHALILWSERKKLCGSSIIRQVSQFSI